MSTSYESIKLCFDEVCFAVGMQSLPIGLLCQYCLVSCGD